MKLSHLLAARLRPHPRATQCLTTIVASFACTLCVEHTMAQTTPRSVPEVPAAQLPADAPPEHSADSGAEPAPDGRDGTIEPKTVDERASTDYAEVERYLQTHPAQDCRPLGVWSSAGRIWVACGPKGYLVFQRSGDGLIPTEARRVEGEVTGFFLQDGRVWARITQERAVVIARADEVVRSPASEKQPRDRVPPRVRRSEQVPPSARELVDSPIVVIGEVTSVNRLEANINIGENAGLELGARVALSKPTADQASDEGRPSVLVGRVVDLDEGSARVRVGVNESVRVGDTARLTDQPVTASRVAPERVTGLWEIRGMARPMLSLGAFGGGALAELEAGYRTQHFHVGARSGPIGVAGASEAATVSTWGAHVYGAYDSWAFSAGLGVGAQSVNDTNGRSDKGAGLSLTQLLRLGAVDGLHLTSRTHAVVFRSETQFAGLEMQGQISVSREAWLILRGGGNDSGYGYGEVAIRNLLDGNGGRGSFFLEVSIGGAAIFQDYCATGADAFSFECSTESVGGPLIGLGGEWRL